MCDRKWGDKTRQEVDDELALENKRHECRAGHKCDDFTNLEQMTDFIQENIVDILPSEFQEKSISYLIEDLEKMRSELYDFKVL
jgi:hypothetical protein